MRIERIGALAEMARRNVAAAGCGNPASGLELVEEAGWTASELEEFTRRDIAVGRACSDPAPGTVRGITAEGQLVVDTADGVRAFRDGSLIFAGASP